MVVSLQLKEPLLSGTSENRREIVRNKRMEIAFVMASVAIALLALIFGKYINMNKPIF